MKQLKNKEIKHLYPFQYKGNTVLFIVLLILFFPVGIILAIKNGVFLKKGKYFAFSYRGSFGWLIFWAILFFPIAFILLFVNGVDIIEGSDHS